MKIILKAIAVLLAVILIAAAGFWFWCRVINHRSFMAGFTDLFLILQHRSDKFTYTDKADEYIESKRETNSMLFAIEEKKVKFGISVKSDKEDALQTFIFNDQTQPAQTVFYFHGGAYVNQPNAQQLTMAARTAKETNSEVVLMVYPKMPVHTSEECIDMCLEYYTEYIKNHECGKIVFMGDSAGGGLALALAQQLKIDGQTIPDELILISPWVDLTMSNKDMEDYVATRLESCFSMAGMKVETSGSYGGWDPNPDSEILHLLLKEYKELFGQDGIIQVDHAGLECSVILGKYPHLDVVSLGPTMKSPHTTQERALIETVAPFWQLLVKTLEDVPAK